MKTDMDNSEKKLEKALVASAADSQFIKSKKLLDNKKEEYADPEKELKEGQEKSSHGEELEKQDIEDRKSNRKMRQNYAEKMFWYMCVWSAVIFIILMFNHCWFQLDRWVLMTLVGSTTINVFAIIRAIIKGIFKE